MFIVMDADALLLVGNDPSIIKGYRRVVLTPNVVEFKRLSENVVSGIHPTLIVVLSGDTAIYQNIDPNTPPEERAALVSRALGGITIVQKGAKDIICTNTGTASSADAKLSKVSFFRYDHMLIACLGYIGGPSGFHRGTGHCRRSRRFETMWWSGRYSQRHNRNCARMGEVFRRRCLWVCHHPSQFGRLTD